jgi:hypothetical protein
MKLSRLNAFWWVSSFVLIGCTAKNGTLKSDPPIVVTPKKDSTSESKSGTHMGSPNREYDQEKIDSIRKHGIKKKKQIPPGDAD